MKKWLFSVLFLACAGAGVYVWYKAEAAADYSAHAALTREICGILEKTPAGESFPNSLSDLRLRYPDGSDPSFLSRFTYTSTETSCTLRTRLGDEEVFRKFP